MAKDRYRSSTLGFAILTFILAGLAVLFVLEAALNHEPSSRLFFRGVLRGIGMLVVAALAGGLTVLS